MALLFRDARIFFAGYEPTTQFNQVALEFEAEALDETAFGDSTRKMRGGLKTARMSGGGYFAAGSNQVDPVFFESIDLSDAVVMVAADDITEGATSSGFVYGFKSNLMSYAPMSQSVGELQGFTIMAEGRGI